MNVKIQLYKKLFILAALLLTSCQSRPYFVYNVAYKLQDTVIVLLGDLHVNGPANSEQRNSLLNALTTMNQKGLVLVEDIASYNGPDRKLAEFIKKKYTQDFVIAHLHNKVQQSKVNHGFDSINIECRFKLRETFAESTREIDTALQQLDLRTNNPVLAQYYQDAQRRLLSNKNIISTFIEKHGLHNRRMIDIVENPCSNLFSQHSRIFRIVDMIATPFFLAKLSANLNRINERGALTLFHWHAEAVDIKIITNIDKAVQSHVPLVIVCAGAAHIINNESVIRQLGGKYLFHHGNQRYKYDNPAQDLNTFFTTLYKNQPQLVSLPVCTQKQEPDKKHTPLVTSIPAWYWITKKMHQQTHSSPTTSYQKYWTSKPTRPGWQPRTAFNSVVQKTARYATGILKKFRI